MKCLAPRHLYFSSRAALVLATVISLNASSQAQSRYCLGGDLQHLSAEQRAACTSRLTDVRRAAQRFGAPEGWHFVMVCGEDNWKAYAPFSSHSAQELERASADTDLPAHTTYLREAMLNVESSPSAQQEKLARVFAGIVLQTSDEAVIQAKVTSWLASAPEEGRIAPVLQASR